MYYAKQDTSTHIIFCFFFFNDTATTEIYTLSLHDALPIYYVNGGNGEFFLQDVRNTFDPNQGFDLTTRSEEHTSELQSPCNLVCRLLLEKKKTNDRERNDVPQYYAPHNVIASSTGT